MTATRWMRQRALPGFGDAGQERLAAAIVVVVGAGGLGSAVLPVLVAAGVGAITVVDDDVVELSNLHRQTLHRDADLGRTKVDSALERLRELGPETALTGSRARVTNANAAAILHGADLVVDATDDLDARYALDDAAAAADIPLVWGSATGFVGQTSVAWASRGPRWRDLFPVRPPDDSVDTCAVGGVLPSLCTTIGGLMAGEVLKLITGVGEPLVGRVVVVDALRASVREIPFSAAELYVIDESPITDAAPDDIQVGQVAEQHPIKESPMTDAAPDETQVGQVAEQHPIKESPMTDAAPDEIQVSQVADLLEDGADVQLVDVREPWEAEIATLPGATLIPLGTLGGRLDELDPARPVVAYCHAGVRSARAVAELRAAGFDARSMVGGIEAWSRVVDPTVPRY